MDEATLTALLEAVRTGEVAPDDAVHQLRRLPWADLGYARVDHHRALRQGMAEVVYGPGKATEHVVGIVGELLDGGDGPVLVSRATAEQAAAALAAHPGGTSFGGEVHDRTLVWRPAAPRPERVVLACAGTADLPVAEECAAVLGAHGIAPLRLTDVGVAGVHRGGARLGVGPPRAGEAGGGVQRGGRAQPRVTARCRKIRRPAR